MMSVYTDNLITDTPKFTGNKWARTFNPAYCSNFGGSVLEQYQPLHDSLALDSSLGNDLFSRRALKKGDRNVSASLTCCWKIFFFSTYCFLNSFYQLISDSIRQLMRINDPINSPKTNWGPSWLKTKFTVTGQDFEQRRGPGFIFFPSRLFFLQWFLLFSPKISK